MPEENRINIEKYPQEILDKIKGKTGDVIIASKATMRGALIGLGAGYLASVFFKLPKMVGIVSGSIVGAVFADAINEHINKIKKCYNYGNTEPKQNS